MASANGEGEIRMEWGRESSRQTSERGARCVSPSHNAAALYLIRVREEELEREALKRIPFSRLRSLQIANLMAAPRNHFMRPQLPLSRSQLNCLSRFVHPPPLDLSHPHRVREDCLSVR